MSRMKQKYNDIVPALREECGIENAMQTPKLEKIVISVGAGEEGRDSKLIANMQETISFEEWPTLELRIEEGTGFILEELAKSPFPISFPDLHRSYCFN